MWLAAWTRRFYLQKFVFEQNLAKLKYLPLENFRLYGICTYGVSKQALEWFPLDLGSVVEDVPSEL